MPARCASDNSMDPLVVRRDGKKQLCQDRCQARASGEKPRFDTSMTNAPTLRPWCKETQLLYQLLPVLDQCYGIRRLGYRSAALW